MPGWNDVLSEIQVAAAWDPFKVVRQRYLKKLSDLLGGRNIISYYSGWLQKPGILESSLLNEDKNAFMTMLHTMDRKKGLDLIIHTPGGDLCACESIVDYLKMMFGKNIRAIVPQLAMSAGTMMSCACNKIVMGKESSLGPIDPQLGGLPAQAVLEEFERAAQEIKKEPSRIAVWQPIISKYHPSYLVECEKSIIYAKQLCEKWLKENMFDKDSSKASIVANALSDHKSSKTHSRQFNVLQCKEMGLKIESLESIKPNKNITEEPKDVVQDTVLTIHHAYMHTFANTNCFKIVENHLGVDISSRLRNR